MPGEGEQILAGGGVPEPDREADGGGGDEAAIRAECDTPNMLVVLPVEGVEQRPGADGKAVVGTTGQWVSPRIGE
jgi:hypothetical protein